MSSVNVTVIDVNDNAPIFVSSAYRVAIGVNTSIGHVIAQLTAKDNDKDDILEYTMTTDEVIN